MLDGPGFLPSVFHALDITSSHILQKLLPFLSCERVKPNLFTEATHRNTTSNQTPFR